MKERPWPQPLCLWSRTSAGRALNELCWCMTSPAKSTCRRTRARPQQNKAWVFKFSSRVFPHHRPLVNHLYLQSRVTRCWVQGSRKVDVSESKQLCSSAKVQVLLVFTVSLSYMMWLWRRRQLGDCIEVADLGIEYNRGPPPILRLAQSCLLRSLTTHSVLSLLCWGLWREIMDATQKL